MRRVIASALVAATGAAAVWAGVGVAGHNGSGARHSDNMALIANYSEGGTYRNGTDMAFWGDLLVTGNLDQGTGPNASPPGGFRLMDVSDPANPTLIGKEVCSGDQSDVSVWEDIVITSVDKPTLSHCDEGEANWEGIRVHSIADRSDPELLTAVRTDCGSHTHTIYPDPANDRLLVYVLSYPLAGRYNPAQALPTCNAVGHRKISVVEVPLSNPAGARVLEDQPSTGQTIGCHDVTVLVTPDSAERDLAAAACLTETQIWSLENPERPEILASIRDPRVNIHHSTTFSNDGRTLVVGDELGGAAASPGCLTDADTYGGLFFYDVSDPAAPAARGTHKLPQQVASLFCTAHLFNVVPTRGDEDVLVTSWYTGATSVIDFTDPSKPEQIAHYIPREPVTPDEQPREAAAWASYWYRGHVFSSNFDEDVNSVSPRSRGLDVFTVEHPLLEGAIDLPRLNPQLQEPLPAAEPARERGRGRGSGKGRGRPAGR